MCELQTWKGLSEPGALVPELSPLKSRVPWLWTFLGGTSARLLKRGRQKLGLRLGPSPPGQERDSGLTAAISAGLPSDAAHAWQGGWWFWPSLSGGWGGRPALTSGGAPVGWGEHQGAHGPSGHRSGFPESKYLSPQQRRVYRVSCPYGHSEECPLLQRRPVFRDGLR